MSSQHIETQTTPATRDIHRALASLQEELEAVDYYQQRSDVTSDAELKAILEHNRDEEIEHAVMLSEWLRRRMPKFDEQMKAYIFSKGSITQAEASASGDGPSESSAGDLGIGKLH
jgi:hypothetical protein